MKKPTFAIRKWLVRGLMVVGAIIGVTACQHSHKQHHKSHKKHHQSEESSMSSSEDESSDIEVIEDVYGPPSEEIETVYGPPVEDLEPVDPDFDDEPVPLDEN